MHRRRAGRIIKFCIHFFLHGYIINDDVIIIQAMSVPPTEEKREILVDCALLIAATVVKWDLDTFEKRYMFRCYQSFSFFLILLRSFLACSEVFCLILVPLQYNVPVYSDRKFCILSAVCPQLFSLLFSRS